VAAAAGNPTHALFADQSHSIPDNLMALLGAVRARNCSAEYCGSYWEDPQATVPAKGLLSSRILTETARESGPPFDLNRTPH
jgi:hypothetical protein